MGTITAAVWLPWLIIGLPAGAWVDRLPPRAVMIAADLVSAVVLLSVPLAWCLDLLTLTQLVVVALAGGVSTVFFRTAYIKLIPLIVTDTELESANARLIGTESAMQIAGPGLGGALVAAVSAAVGLLVDVASFIVSAVCLWRVGRFQRIPDTQPAPVESADGATMIVQIRAGIRVVAHDRNLRALNIVGGLSNFGLTGYAAMLVLYLSRGLRLSSSAVGVVLMVGSCGGLIGASLATHLARRVGNGRASTMLLLVAGPSALLIGLPTQGDEAFLTVAGLMLVGAAVVGGNVIRGAWRQRYVPRQLMGRVVTTSQMVNYGTMPLAGLTAGVLGGQLGVRPTIFVMAAIHAAACWSILATNLGRQRELPAALAG
jgi:MFS family permease